MFIEYKDLAYSVVEDDVFYNVTIVRQGEPGQDIVVQITHPNDSDSTAIGKREW